MTNKITSKELANLFEKTERDEYVFELTDYPGIQIIRKYPTSFSDFIDKRMFIKFILLYEDDGCYVSGGVDTVKNKKESESGWTIEFTSKSFFQRPTNYNFWKSEDIHFLPETNRVTFKNKEYSLSEFISLLEKNHLRDMFWLSRFVNYFKLAFLHILFFFSDAKFKKFDHIFKRDETTSSIRKEKVKPASERADPLFHYFYVYKNLFGATLLICLPILYILSICLPETYFTISNPFLLFLALFLFFSLEKLSDFLFYLLVETEFVQKIARSALESKGKLKAYRI